jgi:REP element-mobilizing transposase RayT
MADYYDRYIRDDKHYDAVVEYIKNNPVKSRLVDKSEKWRWGSAYYRK